MRACARMEMKGGKVKAGREEFSNGLNMFSCSGITLNIFIGHLEVNLHLFGLLIWLPTSPNIK